MSPQVTPKVRYRACAEGGRRQINEAAEKFSQALWDSYQAAIESTAAMREANTETARKLFESGVEEEG